MSSDYQVGVIAKCIAIHSTFRVNSFRESSIPLHEGCQVVVATAVDTCALLDGGLLTPAEIEVAVFDECHFAIDKGSRYLSIAKRLCGECPAGVVIVCLVPVIAVLFNLCLHFFFLLC